MHGFLMQQKMWRLHTLLRSSSGASPFSGSTDMISAPKDKQITVATIFQIVQMGKKVH
jgi:hypothetical protein